MATLGDLVLEVCMALPAPAEGQPWTRESIGFALRRVLRDVMAIRSYRSGDRFVEDMGIDRARSRHDLRRRAPALHRHGSREQPVIELELALAIPRRRREGRELDRPPSVLAGACLVGRDRLDGGRRGRCLRLLDERGRGRLERRGPG